MWFNRQSDRQIFVHLSRKKCSAITHPGEVSNHLWGCFGHFETPNLAFEVSAFWNFFTCSDTSSISLDIVLRSASLWESVLARHDLGGSTGPGGRRFNVNRSCVVIAITVIVYSLWFICGNGGGITLLSEQLKIFLFQWKLFPGWFSVKSISSVKHIDHQKILNK